LIEKGPVWIITGDGITSHASLLVGIYAPDESETFENYKKSIVEIIDPATGTFVYSNALNFISKFEDEAASAFVVNNHLDSIDLRWQVISF
jgi:hypothetical protein